jgi:hypothetical protein
MRASSAQRETKKLEETEAVMTDLDTLKLQLKLRRAWVTLASLEEETSLAQAKLAAVKQEINRHRSWLERLFRRKDRGAEQ